MLAAAQGLRRTGHLAASRQENRSRVAEPKRSQRHELLHARFSHFGEGGLCIHRVHRSQIVFAQSLARPRSKTMLKVRQTIGPQRQSRGLTMSAKFAEQLRHGFQGFEQMKARNASA